MNDVAATSLRINYLTSEVDREPWLYDHVAGDVVCKLSQMYVTPIQSINSEIMHGVRRCVGMF